MQENTLLSYVKEVLCNAPSDWLTITTHRLDIFNEKLAKTAFLSHFETLYNDRDTRTAVLSELPTSYDYIRLGHPLSCILEWTLAKLLGQQQDQVVSFSSKTMPILAILRKNSLEKIATRIVYIDAMPKCFDETILKTLYGYDFELIQVATLDAIDAFDGTTVFVAEQEDICAIDLRPNVDFFISIQPQFGSILVANGEANTHYISEVQHVRRRETIAMTPANTFEVLQRLVGNAASTEVSSDLNVTKERVFDAIREITTTNTRSVVGSSGLSTQYAIAMGLVAHAFEQHPGKKITFIVPPNCYGGTNDQARRVAACSEIIDVVDLLVDGGEHMDQSIDQVLEEVAKEDAVPYIIVEIPTNPRVEVPDLNHLKEVLTKKRLTAAGATAIDPVFIVDQTFCPNVHFLGKEAILASVKTISYVSGSKFPSGGQCTAGYAVANEKAAFLMDTIAQHLNICDNEATALQYEILAKQLPSMKQRIQEAYANTRAFVNFVSEVLPAAKINFVSEALAAQGFTPSVFSLDLPTKGDTEEERESYKRALNLQLINVMIQQIPHESKYCVSYGQLKGCYWTIPATSTQGTTKEGDKDYIARVALSPNIDLELHKKVFREFVAQMA